jgi:ferrochelatase
MSDAVLLVSHGTVDDLKDIEAFVTNVRRGHPPPPALVAELRRRYEAIGGASPLNATSAELARKLERKLGVRTAWANRLWRPYVRDVIGDIARTGVRRIAVVPLAQHSAHVYAADARRVAVTGMRVECAPNWGKRGDLCAVYARRIVDALSGADLDATTVLLTAHSLPRSVVDAGDPYEQEVRQAFDAITALVGEGVGRRVASAAAFQSQGFGPGPGGKPIEWLGPDLKTAIDAIAARGGRHVVFAPAGFLADHVETLYDIDVEAAAMAEAQGMTSARAALPNADDDFVDVLVDLSRAVLREDSSRG